MALQAANQFQLGTDFSQLGRGVQQGQQIASQFQLGQQRRDAAQRATDVSGRQATQFEQEQSIQRAGILNQSARALKSLPVEQRQAALQQLTPRLAEFNIDASVFQGADLSDVELDQAIASTQGLVSRAGLTSAQREFESQTAGLSEADKLRARRVDLGLDPRAGISAAERIAASPETTEDVAKSEAAIAREKAAATETAKLSAQLELKPEVESAVVAAVADAKINADIKKEDRSNQKALDVYTAAKDNLVTALGGTTTGPGAGFIPALTANAQIANGAVAMMAPVLKQMFRSAGEGTFTDQDQKMLLAMVPTRDTLPEARTAQLAAIDAVVDAKLGRPSQEAIDKTEQQNTFTSSTGIQFTVE